MNVSERAQNIANALIQMELRGAGDTEGSMRRLANRYGLNWRVFWTLRYRRPNNVFAGVYEKLEQAYRAECRRQLQRLQHELEVAERNAVPADDLKAQVDALVARMDEARQQLTGTEVD